MCEWRQYRHDANIDPARDCKNGCEGYDDGSLSMPLFYVRAESHMDATRHIDTTTTTAGDATNSHQTGRVIYLRSTRCQRQTDPWW